MVMGRKEVAVDFITRLKDKGFKDLEKSTNKQSKVLAGLGKQLAAVFSVAAVVKFGKASVSAFQDAQKEANQLRTQLKSLNLGFAQLQITDFIRDLALTTGVTGGVLTDAFITLSQATNDATKAQKLLKLSLDISASTGKDLKTVTVALQRAQAGQLSALTRLQIGFTRATLEGKDFDEVLADLEKKFSGSALVAADTFEGKINRLKEAVEEAKEAFGESLVEGIEASNVSVETLQKNIIDLGKALGTITGKLIAFNQSVIQDITKEFEEDQGYFATFVKSLVKTNKDLAAIDGGRLRAASRARAEIRKVEAENAKAIKKNINLQKKADADKKRNAQLDKLRNSIQFKFDIDAINLQAALRRQLSQSDRDRALQLSALKISDYQTDEEAIKTLQAATQGRYDDAMNLEKVLQLLKTAGFAADQASINALAALKPDIKFTDNLDNILAKLKAIIEGKYTISIGATISVPNIPAPGNSAAAGGLPGTFDPGRIRKKDEDTSKDLLPPTPPVIKPPYIDLPGEIGGEPFKRPFVPDLGSFRFFEENQDSYLRNLYDKTSVPSNFDVSSSRYFEETGFSARGMATPSFFNPAGFRARDEGVTVNVNIEGSLLSQNDLVAAVTDAVYQTQRTGNDLIVSAI